MKTIGLIGGMSWESSLEYYRVINRTVKERLGGLHSARSLMYSVDFAEIETLQHEGKWKEAATVLAAAGMSLQRGGADFVILCTNTMHKVVEEIQGSLDIPILHIADATAEQIKGRGLDRVGLLGTRFTMEEDFYKGRLSRRHGLEVIIPGPMEREAVHRVIYDELCLGRMEQESRALFVAIMRRMVQEGAQGIILGCTEIGLLVGDRDCDVPLFDTTRIHAVAAVNYALA